MHYTRRLLTRELIFGVTVVLRDLPCGLRHSLNNEPIPHQRRLSDVRRQSIAHLVHLSRGGDAEILTTAVRHHKETLEAARKTKDVLPLMDSLGPSRLLKKEARRKLLIVIH
jgi:hypothetical protein